MASTSVAAISAFIEGAPPGELTDVVNDIKALTSSQPTLLTQALPAFRKYNEEQLTVVSLLGSSKEVLISAYNSLGNDRYFSPLSNQTWAFDHITQKPSSLEPYSLPSPRSLLSPLTTHLSLHASEHYPTSTSTVLPPHPSTPIEDALTLLLTTNKYSPQNYYTGRLRAVYFYHPASSTLTGELKCDVHYYEDGNVRLTVAKKVGETKVEVGVAGGEEGEAKAVVRAIAKVEKEWQEELGRGFQGLSEGSFKGLRRQLPVTRQKMEWEKVGGLRVGREIGGRGGGGEGGDGGWISEGWVDMWPLHASGK